jgi:hypothetical protein
MIKTWIQIKLKEFTDQADPSSKKFEAIKLAQWYIVLVFYEFKLLRDELDCANVLTEWNHLDSKFY